MQAPQEIAGFFIYINTTSYDNNDLQQCIID